MEQAVNTQDIILNEWNNTVKAFSTVKTIYSLFDETVMRSPDNPALYTNTSSLTYKELQSRVNVFADNLVKQGHQKDEYIGVYLDRSFDTIISLLAIFKIGCAYVPFNLSDPIERIEKIIKASDLSLIITSSAHKDKLPGSIPALCIDTLNLNDTSSVNYNEIRCTPLSNAYVIFTSGTTGTPKGVLVKHQSVINLIEWVNNTFNVDENDRLLWTTNLSFDLSVYDIFGTLAAGASVRILNEAEQKDPEKQVEIIQKEKITFWDSAPQAVQLLVPYLQKDNNKAKSNDLRLVFASGDWIPLNLPDTLKVHFPNMTFVALGGATEATIWSNYFIVDHIDPSWKSIPYGKPIQNSRYYILDEAQNHCDVGAEGDLYIGGKCLAVGYYGDEALTKKKFVPDPYNNREPMYFTGDKARWIGDGNIEFLGRVDDQVKVRGFRVELEEIRYVARKLDGVHDVILLADKSDKFDTKLVLAYTCGQSNVSVETVREHLNEYLPLYMVPTNIMQYDRFPITANGKTDNRAILEAQIVRSEPVDDKVLDEVERKIRDIWSKTLQINNISATDNYFSIGGDSLKALQIIFQIEKDFNIEIKANHLFENPTIKQLAEYVKSKDSIVNKGLKPAKTNRKDRLSLSKEQQRLWMIYKMDKKNPSYNIPITYRLEGDLDIEKLHQAIHDTFSRHRILQCEIELKDSKPYFVLKDEQLPQINIYDYSGKNIPDQNVFIQEFCSKETRNAIDLHKRPLYRIHLLKFSDRSWCLHFTIHHIVFDGWSWDVFITDLNKFYNSGTAVASEVNEDGIIQYYDYADWQKLNKKDPDQEVVNYWKKNLENYPVKLNLPVDFSSDYQYNGKGEKIAFSFDHSLSVKIDAISKQQQVSPFIVMLSAYSLLLSKYSQEDDLCIGMPVANRVQSFTEQMVGYFVNTLVIRQKLGDIKNFSDLVLQTKQLVDNAFKYEDMPIDQLVNMINPERIINTNPLFQVVFAWQTEEYKKLDFDNIETKRIMVEKGVAPLDLALYMWKKGEVFAGELEFNPNLFRHKSIDLVLSNFISLTNEVCENANIDLGDISFISEAEKKWKQELNITDLDFEENTIFDLYTDTFKKYANKLALKCGDESLSYSELDKQSNRIANYLIDKKIEVGDVVGLAFSRSALTLPFILGVLKTGACYLPIELSSPKKRLTHIFNETNAKLLVTDNNFKELFQGIDINKIVLEEEIDKIKAFPSEMNNKPKIEGDTVAYIMYTSGSTGLPKGIQVMHRNVVNFIKSLHVSPGISDKDRVLAPSTFTFDISVTEIFAPLSVGASIIMTDEEQQKSMQSIVQLLNKEAITLVQGTPITWKLMAEMWEGSPDVLAITGGQAIDKALIAKLLPKVKELWNLYGPTETTVWSTRFRIKNATDKVLVGKPIENTKIKILNESNIEQPIGVVGEVTIGGKGVTKGYLNRPELNRDRFIYLDNDPYYKTGDLGILRSDGNIELLGRADNQINLRGNRVEPDEIEAKLCLIDGISDAVVKKIQYGTDDDRLIAFLKISENEKVEKRDIKSFLRAWLPDYMVPFDFVYMSTFPVTPNGKTDRKALVYNPAKPKNSKDNEAKNEQVDYHLSKEELEKILSFNDTKVEYQRDKHIIQLFKEKCTEFSDKLALAKDVREFTYAELDRITDLMAAKLQSYDVSIEEPVGILFNKSPEYIFALFAILKAGGAYLPIDPGLPAKRIDYILNDANCRLVLSESKLKGVIDNNVEVVCIDDNFYDSNNVAEPLAVDLKPDQLAYIMYTSGTTGEPKGSLIENRGIMRLVNNTNYAEIQPDDKFLLTGAIGFDATTFEIWGALLNGATLYLTDNETILDNKQLAKDLKKYQITTLWLTSSLFTLHAEIDVSIFSNLKYLLVGGDVASVSHINKVKENCPGVTLINGYGPTENTTFSTCHVIERLYNDKIPIGKPISNSTAYVLNNKLDILPIGVEGELYVGGDGLSRGYLNREELTKERFIDNPFVPGERLYKTGDLAKWNENGELLFGGRKDNQLKFRGFRIELGEIEAELNAIPDVIEAVVKPQIINGKVNQLYAFIHAKPGFKQDAEEVKSLLKMQLPEYMVPKTISFVKEFKKNLNGKIDRGAITINDDISTNTAIDSEMTPTEKEIFNIFSKLLSLDDIDIEDNFFDIGGHSLLALQLIADIEKQYKLQLSYKDFISQYNSIKQIADLIENKPEFLNKENAKSNQLYLAQPEGDLTPLFMVFGEKALIYDDDCFGKDRPVFEFVWPGTDGEKIVAKSVEEIAKDYVSQILAVRPHGPYLLAGFSFGGIVAYEIALQLQKMGEPVPQLVLIDTSHPDIVRHWEQVPWLSIKKFALLKSRLHILSLYVIDRIKASFKNRRMLIVESSARLLLNYYPEDYDGKVLLFSTKNLYGRLKYSGWEKSVKQIRAIQLKGGHIEIITIPETRAKISVGIKEFLSEHKE